jgi:hypothetical protein
MWWRFLCRDGGRIGGRQLLNDMILALGVVTLLQSL